MYFEVLLGILSYFYVGTLRYIEADTLRYF